MQPEINDQEYLEGFNQNSKPKMQHTPPKTRENGLGGGIKS